MLFIAANTNAQIKDSTRQKQVGYLSRKLGVDENKAGQIASVNDTYKAGVQAVMNDPRLTDKAKRAKIDQLIADKNKQLSVKLTAAQMDKITSRNERKKSSNPNADSLQRQNQIKLLGRRLSVDDKKAVKVAAIHDDYKLEVNQVVNDNSLSEPAKRARIDQLIALKNTKLSTILTPEQQDKIIPERKKVKKDGRSPEPSREMIAVQDTFAGKLRLVKTNSRLSETAKHAQVERLMKERDEKLEKASLKKAQANLINN